MRQMHCSLYSAELSQTACAVKNLTSLGYICPWLDSPTERLHSPWQNVQYNLCFEKDGELIKSLEVAC